MNWQIKNIQEKHKNNDFDALKIQDENFWERTVQFRFGVVTGVFVGLGICLILIKMVEPQPENAYKNLVVNDDETEEMAKTTIEKQQGTVLSDKAFLYETPDRATKKEDHLMNNQNVELLETSGEFFKISYKNINGNCVTAWVLKTDIQKVDLIRRTMRFSMQ